MNPTISVEGENIDHSFIKLPVSPIMISVFDAFEEISKDYEGYLVLSKYITILF